jgi:peptide/nickel transport system substrate-binding protein
MTAAQVCGTNNISQLQTMMFRPLYWFGNDYSPTMDPDYSLAEQPAFSNGDKTVTVKLKPWKWSNGEAVTSRQVAFWMNLYKADPSKNYCGYVPGYFPDNVTSVQTAPRASTSSSTRSPSRWARGTPLRCGAWSTARSSSRASPATGRSR